jgi:Protein of unknown function (DUF418)
MLVAHLSPAGGIFTLSEYLTAPLFAVVIGVAMGIHLADRRPGAGQFLLENLQRGVLLVVLGVLLQEMYSRIIVVLPYLGLLIVVLAPLALLLHRAPLLTLGVAVAGAVLGPIVRERVALAWGFGGDLPPGAGELVTWLALGEAYRLLSFLPMALGGLALATVLRRVTEVPVAYAVSGVLLSTAAVAYLLGRGSAEGARPYSGVTAEVVGATLLATGAVVASFVVLHLARRAGVGWLLAPVVATGRLALTAYTLQILFLAVLEVFRGGASDDTWLVLAYTTVVVLGVCWALDRWWGTGPLEWVVHRLRPTPRPAGRHAPRHAS